MKEILATCVPRVLSTYTASIPNCISYARVRFRGLIRSG